MPDPARPHIFIATHHKAGTVWMNTTFRRIGKLNHFEFVHLNTAEPAWTTRPDKTDYYAQERARVEALSDRPAIFVDYHSTTPDLSTTERARGLHMIRDPRDMLISAIHYHKVSDERWLDHPSPKWGGNTFRQQLTHYDGEQDQIRFELDTFMGWTINQMTNFLDRPDHARVFRTVRYEDLILDEDMTQFHDLCIHLELGGTDLINALRAYWQSSIFGGMKPAHQSGTHAHIRHAGVAQWRDALSAGSLDLIQSRMGPQIEKLGYELV